MAIVVTSRGTGYTAFGNSVTVSAFTPSANSILWLIARENQGEATISSITGHGTWNQLSGSPVAYFGDNAHCYWLNTGGTPSSNTVVVTWASGSNALAVGIAETTETNLTTPNVQQQTGTIYITTPQQAITPDTALNAFADANNVCLALVTNSQGYNWDIQNSFTELFDTGNSDSNVACHYKLNDNSPSCLSNGAATNDHGSGFFIEVSHDAGGGSNLPIFQNYYRQQD